MSLSSKLLISTTLWALKLLSAKCPWCLKRLNNLSTLLRTLKAKVAHLMVLSLGTTLTKSKTTSKKFNRELLSWSMRTESLERFTLLWLTWLLSLWTLTYSEISLYGKITSARWESFTNLLLSRDKPNFVVVGYNTLTSSCIKLLSTNTNSA